MNKVEYRSVTKQWALWKAYMNNDDGAHPLSVLQLTPDEAMEVCDQLIEHVNNIVKAYHWYNRDSGSPTSAREARGNLHAQIDAAAQYLDNEAVARLTHKVNEIEDTLHRSMRRELQGEIERVHNALVNEHYDAEA